VALVLPEMLTPADRAGVSRDALLRGLGLALIAAVGWAGSASFLRLGLQDFDVVAASCLRLVVTFGALMLLGGGMRGARAWRQAGLRATSLVMLAGIVGSGLSAMMFLAAIQLAGTTQAATLSATAPLWAAPLSAIFLGEQMSGLLVLGIVMSVAGVWLLL
jgi:drug/metabolite transporter (DMT)-like permease